MTEADDDPFAEEKPRGGGPPLESAGGDPWDMSPATSAQLDHIKEMGRRIAEADLSKLDTTVARQTITQLNAVR